MPKREAAQLPAPETLLELDLGDDELVVKQHPDGMVTFEHAEPRLLVNEEQFKQILDAFEEEILRRRLGPTP